jgi:TonB family protein
LQIRQYMKPLLLILIATFFCAHTYAQKADTSIFTTPVEIMPQYRGGEESLYFRLQHIRYIFADRMKNIQGKVLVMFVVEKDGTISNVKMVQGLMPEQDSEVLRVVSNLKKWKPGIHDGKPVRVQLAIPIDFKMVKS